MSADDRSVTRVIVHGKLQRIRGMITDGESREAIEDALADAVDLAKDVEEQRDRLRKALENIAALSLPYRDTVSDRARQLAREALR